MLVANMRIKALRTFVYIKGVHYVVYFVFRAIRSRSLLRYDFVINKTFENRNDINWMAGVC